MDYNEIAPAETLRQFLMGLKQEILFKILHSYRQVNYPTPNVHLPSMGSIPCPVKYLNNVGLYLTFQLLQPRAQARLHPPWSGDQNSHLSR